MAAFEIFSLRRREANGLRMPEERPRPTRARLGRLFERLRWGTPPRPAHRRSLPESLPATPSEQEPLSDRRGTRWHGPGEPLQALVIEEREPAGVEAVFAVFEARDRLLSRQSLQRELRRALPVTRESPNRTSGGRESGSSNLTNTSTARAGRKPWISQARKARLPLLCRPLPAIAETGKASWSCRARAG